MLQNRVDPSGNIIKTIARGAWMGNRGILHNESRELLRPFKLKAWLTCKLKFNGRQRNVMAPDRYTELFFLDEATSFAAGHRPCFECRREDFTLFKSYWLKGNGHYGFDLKTPVSELDKILHIERMNRKRQKLTYSESIDDLPDGTFVLLEEKPYLVRGKMLYGWTPSGYEKGVARPHHVQLQVLTPKSIVNTFLAGYRPQIAVGDEEPVPQ